MLIGYSLAHNQVFLPIFGQSLSLIPILKESGIVKPGEQVIIGQKCLNADYQKQGLMGMMDKILYTHLSHEFKYYLASIALTNSSSLDFVTRSGYREVYTSDTRKYFLTEIMPYELTEESYTTETSQGTQIRARFATAADTPALMQMNAEWMKENRSDLSHGYLAALFSEDNWDFMIQRKWVVLAETE